MRFYSQSHQYYCGIDLHTRTLSLCLLDAAGAVRLEATLPPDRDRLAATLAQYSNSPPRCRRLVLGIERHPAVGPMRNDRLPAAGLFHRPPSSTPASGFSPGTGGGSPTSWTRISCWSMRRVN